MDRTTTALHRFVMHTAIFAFALCATACHTTPATSPLSPSAVRLELDAVQQDDRYDCGVASVVALCLYWRVDLDQERRAKLLEEARAGRGLSGDELCSVLSEVGLDTYLFAGALDRSSIGLYGHVDAGRPPLVMLAVDGSARHYALVLGYDEPTEQVLLLDPERGEVHVSAARFEREWARCEYFTLLAVPSSTDRSGRASRADLWPRASTRRISS